MSSQLSSNSHSSCFINLSNKGDHHLAFEIKATNPKKYNVSPNAGIVLPGCMSYVKVTMQAQRDLAPHLECKDTFFLKCVVVNEGATIKDITPEIFVKEHGKMVEELRLGVAYTSADPPFLPEGAKEGLSRRRSLPENGNQRPSLLDGVPRSLHESVMDNSIQVLHEKESKNSPSHGLSILFVVVAGLLGIISGYFTKKKGS